MAAPKILLDVNNKLELTSMPVVDLLDEKDNGHLSIHRRWR